MKPSCFIGYTEDDLKQLIGEDLSVFYKWIAGQTVAVCDGKEYDYELKKYIPTKCHSPHGTIFYCWDVDRFLGKK